MDCRREREEGEEKKFDSHILAGQAVEDSAAGAENASIVDSSNAAPVNRWHVSLANPKPNLNGTKCCLLKNNYRF